MEQYDVPNVRRLSLTVATQKDETQISVYEYYLDLSCVLLLKYSFVINVYSLHLKNHIVFCVSTKTKMRPDLKDS